MGRRLGVSKCLYDQTLFPQRLPDVVKHIEGRALFSGWPSTEREVRATFKLTPVCVCLCMYMCMFMWLYGCAFTSLSTTGMEGTKETFPLTFDPGLCAANQTLCLFFGGVRVEPTTLFFFCVSLSSHRPSPLSF